MSHPSPHGRLGLGVKLGYGICDLGGNLFFTVTAFMLPNFLTDTVGLSPRLMGLALMIGRIWDMAVDPFIGYASDRTVSRWGRRRPYLLFVAVPLWFMTTAMFTAPGFAGQMQLFAWTIVTYSILCSTYSLLNIPYSSLTPELTDDYNERTVLNGYRMSFAVVGTLLGAGVALPLVSLFPTKAAGHTAMGAIFGFIMAVTALVTFAAVREPATGTDTRSTDPIIASYVTAFRNRPFVVLLASWVLHNTGITILGGTMIYYFKYIFKAESLTTVAMLILLASAILFIPVWVAVSKRRGKRACSIAGMFLIAFSLLLLYLLGARLGVKFFFAVMLAAGAGLSTQYVFPYSSIPDTVDYDYVVTGARREGVYYAVWTFTVKLGQAFAGVLIGWILTLGHYQTGAIQPSESIVAIRILFGPLPMAIYCLGAAMLFLYPLTGETFQDVRRRIKEREAAAAR